MGSYLCIELVSQQFCLRSYCSPWPEKHEADDIRSLEVGGGSVRFGAKPPSLYTGSNNAHCWPLNKPGLFYFEIFMI